MSFVVEFQKQFFLKMKCHHVFLRFSKQNISLTQCRISFFFC